MKGLIATLGIATMLVLASPAGAHTWGGNLYPYGTNPGSSYVTSDEAGWTAINSLRWVEGLYTLRWNAHDRISDTSLWVGIRATNGSLHQCKVSWLTSGPQPHGWAVRCY